MCSYLGHAYPKWLTGCGCFKWEQRLSEGFDGGASLWEEDGERLNIHQNTAISSNDQGSSDEEVGLIGTHQ